MILLTPDKYYYETENIVRLFFPDIQIKKPELIDKDENYLRVAIGKNEITIDGIVFGNTISIADKLENTEDKYIEIKIATLLFDRFVELTGFTPAWGILTGVRPAKLFSMRVESLGGVEKAEEYFLKSLKVKPEKIRLVKDTIDAENIAKSHSKDNSFSLYVSIPFCPTRCKYCSFVSQSIEKADSLVEPYVDLLVKEIEETSNVAKENNLQLSTVYWGGGTPTQLNPNQLDKILTAIEDNFDTNNVIEYTVEAGRPDTVTIEKLKVLNNHNVDRISINPQTMFDCTLEKIGRRHSVEQVVDAYNMAREIGFNSINMDLIAGLPDETPEMFEKTLESIINLDPENITVHTLSLKRSSTFTEYKIVEPTAFSNVVSEMLNLATEKLYNNKYLPYYMYRQSKMIGNMENIGWAKKTKECLYNIYMMNELHTVISVGAGGVTRLKSPYGNYIERIFNYKYPYEYISRFEEMISRKKGVTEFYEKIRV